MWAALLFSIGMVSATSTVAAPPIADAVICADSTLASAQRVLALRERGWTDQGPDFPRPVFLQSADFMAVSTGNSTEADAKVLEWVTGRAEKQTFNPEGIVLGLGSVFVLVATSAEGRSTCSFVSKDNLLDDFALALNLEIAPTDGPRRVIRRRTDSLRISAYEYPADQRPGLELLLDTSFTANFSDKNPTSSEITP
jgi:hypothetical protein